MTIAYLLFPAAYFAHVDQRLAVAGFIVVAIGVAVQRLASLRPAAFTENLPRIREPQGSRRFRWKTRLSFYRECRDLYREAYERYSDKGKTVLVPGPGLREEVILPSNAIRWLITQPDHVLSVRDARADYEQLRYSLGDDAYARDAWHASVIRKELIPALDQFSGHLWEELGLAVDVHLGVISEWRAINLHNASRRIVAQVCGRYSVGSELCRRRSYIDACLAVMDGWAASAGVLNSCPDMVKPLVGSLLRLALSKPVRNLKLEIKPLFTECLGTTGGAGTGKEVNGGIRGENSSPLLLDMLICHAAKERPLESNLDSITNRLALCNFESIFQTSFAATNLILDVLASNSEFGTIASLKEEIALARATSKPGANFWNKTMAASMVRAASVARETMRLNSFTTRAMARKVVACGVEMEDGVQLPRGSTVSILSYPMHCDDEIFDNASTFHPFRHCGEKNESQLEDNLGLITTGPQFLPFGHGRSACPGRFLVDLLLKMLLVYLIENYEIRLPRDYRGKRPENQWMGEIVLPPPDVQVQIRRCGRG